MDLYKSRLVCAAKVETAKKEKKKKDQMSFVDFFKIIVGCKKKMLCSTVFFPVRTTI